MNGGAIWRIVAALACVLLLTAAPAAGGSSANETGCGLSELAPQQATPHQMRTSALCLINRARDRHGLPRLSFDPGLRASATAHSRDMVEHRYFSHTGSSGSDVGLRIGRAGYDWSMAAEVIGGGPARYGGSAYAVFARWMQSPGHRSVILDPRLRDFGVGVWLGYPDGGGRSAATYTVDFARP